MKTGGSVPWDPVFPWRQVITYGAIWTLAWRDQRWCSNSCSNYIVMWLARYTWCNTHWCSKETISGCFSAHIHQVIC